MCLEFSAIHQEPVEKFSVNMYLIKIIRLCPSDFVYISINLFFFEPLSKKLIFKHIFKENHKVLPTEISVLV